MTEGSSPSRDLVGKTLAGRYEVQKKIGKGAMGEVYQAMHTMIKKSVAIKVLHPSMSEREDIIERFQREALAAAHIEHPNICSATDFGKGDDGAFFLVMEFLEGAPLKDRMEESAPFPPERATSIVAQIASALGSARALGIVHRDLKPDNVFLIHRGHTDDFVKIVDFGIAQVYLDDEEGTRLTAAGEIFGTPQYMAPEQAEGGEIDHRTDLYALGVMFYEMLTGDLPFRADSPLQLLWKHVMEPPPDMNEKAPDGVTIPQELQTIVLKLMAKKPDDRFQTSEELLTALNATSFAHQAPSHLSMFSGASFAPVGASGPTPVTSPPPGADPSTRPPTSSDEKPGARARNVATQLFEKGKPLAVATGALVKQGSKAALVRFKGLPPKVRMGIIGGFAVLLLVMLVWMFVGGDDEKIEGSKAPAADSSETLEAKESFDGQLKALHKDKEIGPAIRLAESKSTTGLAVLEEKKGEHSDNLAYLAVLGRAHARAGKDEDAIPYFAQLLEKEPGLIYHAFVVENLIEFTTRRQDEKADPAVKLLREYMNPELGATLFEMAFNSKERHGSDRARDLLLDKSDVASLESWQVTLLKIRATPSRDCAEAKELLMSVVTELKAPALPALKELRSQNRDCGALFGGTCRYPCMKKELKDVHDAVSGK